VARSSAPGGHALGQHAVPFGALWVLIDTARPGDQGAPAGLRLAGGQAHRAGHASTADAAIPNRHLEKVLLVIFLSEVERLGLRQLRRDSPVPRLSEHLLVRVP